MDNTANGAVFFFFLRHTFIPDFGRGAYGECSRLEPKGHKSHFSVYDF